MAIAVVSLVLGLQLAGGQQTQVFKCTDAGTTAYQSVPCPGATQAIRKVATKPHDPRVDQGLELLRAQLRDQWGASRKRSAGTKTRRATARPAAPDACQRARAGRDTAFKKAGLARSFELSSRWDNAVHEACR